MLPDAGVPKPRAIPPPIQVLAPGDELKDLDAVECRGELLGETSLALRATTGGKIAGRLSGPAGTMVTLGELGPTVTLADAPTAFALDPLPLALDAGAGDEDELEDDVPIYVSWVSPAGARGGAEIRCAAKAALWNAFTQVKRGPVRWPAEGEARYPRDTLLVLDEFGGNLVLQGPYGATLHDVDFIALQRVAYRDFSPCRYDVVDTATGQRTGRSETMRRSAADIVVDLYDRRTGKRLKSKTYRAPAPDCPAELPMSAVVADVTGANMDDLYQTVVEERPDDAPAELPLPRPTLVVPPDEPGAAIAELPALSLPTLAERYAALGLRPVGSGAAKVETDSGGVQEFTALGELADGTLVVVEARDYGPTRSVLSTVWPVTYVVGGRRAVELEGDRVVARRVLPALLGRPFASPAALAEALAGFGYVADELPSVADEPGVESWSFRFTRKDESFLLHHTDWSLVADGKAPGHAVARTRDAFVVVSCHTPGKARELLAKLTR